MFEQKFISVTEKLEPQRIEPRLEPTIDFSNGYTVNLQKKTKSSVKHEGLQLVKKKRVQMYGTANDSGIANDPQIVP